MPKPAVLARRRKILQLHLQGFSQDQIAACLHVGQASVSRHINAVAKEWRSSNVRNFEADRAREIERVNLVEREAWLAYRQSQQPVAVTQTVVADDGKHTTRKTVTPRHGDGQLLAIIQKCVALRRDLLGLAPAVEPGASANVVLEPSVFRARIIARLEELRDRERLQRDGGRLIQVEPGDVRPAVEPGQVEAGRAPEVPGSDAGRSD